jgi:myo-inositol-1(or 4)-monophosphatase
LGVVYDPFCNELWTALRGKPAYLNGRRIQASRRNKLSEVILAIGFAKEAATLDRMLPMFNHLIHRVRKVRIMGSAALALVYVASGRMDAYVEYGLRLWDIAAGGLIIECAGGDFWNRPLDAEYAYQILASNGRVGVALKKICF